MRIAGLGVDVRGMAAVVAAMLLLAGCTSTASTAVKPKQLSLTIGAMIPQTGGFSSLAPAETAGIKLAADDINQAALGITVKVETVDSGDATGSTAVTAASGLVAKHVDAVVGPTGNDVTKLVIDQLTAAGIVMVSPQNNAAEFSTYKDHGLYFRTSPSDDLQGTALGTLMATEGASRLGVIVLDNDYGNGIQSAMSASFQKAGGSVVSKQTIAPTDTGFTQQVAAIVKAKPDAIAIVTGSQAVSIVPALVAAGIPAKDLYFTDSDLLQYGPSMPVPLTGAQGVAAGPVLDPFFQKKVLAIDPTLTSFAYAPESYDAVVTLALAALAARSVAGAKIAAKMPAVTGGSGHGEKATDFASAAQIILGGDAVDYDGYSGGIAFDKNGDPTKAVIGAFRYGSDNMFTRLK